MNLHTITLYVIFSLSFLETVHAKEVLLGKHSGSWEVQI